MADRYGVGLLLLGIAIACSGAKETSDSPSNGGGAGSRHSAGSSAAGAPSAGASGEVGFPDDTPPGGAGGAATQLNTGGGTGALASMQFWTAATQHIDITCFGFFDGYATFRADRAQLDGEQLALLANQTGIPGSTYDDNDDGIHCVVTTRDAEAHEHQFTIDGSSDLIGAAADIGGAGGEGGADFDYPLYAVLGCEFHHPFPNIGPAFSARPLCVRELWAEGKSSSFNLDLELAGKPYHVELIHCDEMSIGDTTLQLFGSDPGTPLATGVAPTEKTGPHDACLVLDGQVDSPVVGRLVFNSASSKLTEQQMIFR